MYSDLIRCDHPLEMCAEKPFHGTHEVNGDVLLQKLLEPSFDGGIGQKVDKVLNVDAKGEWFQ
jgi:hypothetical protein